jgi:hypothetical protein
MEASLIILALAIFMTHRLFSSGIAPSPPPPHPPSDYPYGYGIAVRRLTALLVP